MQELGGDEGDEEAVASLKAAALRVWDGLSRDPEIHSLVGVLAAAPQPLPTLAEVSERLFQDGVNWGRVILFFYVTYRVVSKALWGAEPLRAIVDWAVSFVQRRLCAWVLAQGGWEGLLSYFSTPTWPTIAAGVLTASLIAWKMS
ncbi:apoptosis regulator BAX-like [Aegotheles albertisi]